MLKLNLWNEREGQLDSQTYDLHDISLYFTSNLDEA